MKECKWDQDEDHGFYETSCKEAFEFTDAGPEENKFRFCPFCGGQISIRELTGKEFTEKAIASLTPKNGPRKL